MRTLPAIAPTPPQVDDDQAVSDELVGRLLQAGTGAVFELLDRFSPMERANLAMFCYRKTHLHRLGLAIAATCDEDILIAAWGTTIGQTVYQQSRERAPARTAASLSHRPKVSLAKGLSSHDGAFATLRGKFEELEESDPPMECAA